MTIEYALIHILHGAAGEAFAKMPFHQSQEDEVARDRMWRISNGLASWLRSNNMKRLQAMLKGRL